jgi:PBSX family phage terminase large subunit
MGTVDLSRVTRLLSPIQIRSIVESQARVNIWSGAIRSGKTVSSLLRWLIYIATAPIGGRLVMSGRTKETIGRNLFDVLEDRDIFGPLADKVQYNRGANTATILGRVVEIIGASDKRAEMRLRGMTCSGAYIDEATLVPLDFWTQMLGRLSVPGSKLFATTNPGNPAHWLRQDFLLRADRLNLASWHFTLDDNPSLDPEYVASIKAEFVGLFYRRFILGEWVSAEGAVYDMWDPQVHVVDELPPIVRWLGVGIDYGTTNPFSALLLGLGADGVLYLVNEWRYDARAAHRQLTDVEYSERVRGWLTRVPIPGAGARGNGSVLTGVHPEYVVVDPSAASFRVQLHKDGVTNIPADNEVLDGIRMMSSLLVAGKLKVHRSCEGFLAEAGGYAWDDGAQAQGEDRPIKVDDHSLDAARYAVKTTQSLWEPAVQLQAA